MVAYPDSNSLVVKGGPEQIRYVRQLVNALDDSRLQVGLSLWIIDVVRVKLDNLGVRWESGNLDTGGGKVTFNRSTHLQIVPSSLLRLMLSAKTAARGSPHVR